jgi:hypothetical protein
VPSVNRAALAALIVPVVILGAGGSRAAGATGTPPELRSNLRAAALPPVVLPDELVSATEALLGGAADRYGITAESFDVARQLGETSIGLLYLIPGSSGACLLLVGRGLACGDPGSPGSPILSIGGSNRSGYYVGGGVAADGVSTVNLGGERGPQHPIEVDANGVFMTPTAPAVKAGRHVGLRPPASAIGSTRAFAAARAVPDGASRMMTNCARYAPVYNLNFNCTVYQSMPVGDWWTPGHAARISNHISVTSLALVTVCYSLSSGGNCASNLPNMTTWSTFATIGGTGSTQAYSVCSVNANEQGGECDTTW